MHFKHLASYYFSEPLLKIHIANKNKFYFCFKYEKCESNFTSVLGLDKKLLTRKLYWKCNIVSEIEF